MAVALLAPAALWLALDSGSTRSVLRARVEAELAARCPGATLDGAIRVDRLFRLVAGPVAMPSRTAGSPPLVSVERIRVRPRLLALVTGKLEAASITLDGVHIEGGSHGEALTDLARACTARARTESPRSYGSDRALTLAFSRLFVSFGERNAAAPRPRIGPLAGTARFHRMGAQATAQVSLRLPGAGYVAAQLRWGAAGKAALEANLRGLGPAALPDSWRARLPADPGKGSLDVEVHAPELTALESGEARLRIALRGLELRSEHLAATAIGPLSLLLTGTVRWDLRAPRLSLERARVDLGDSGRVGVPFRAVLTTRPEPWIELETGASELDWEAMMAALPPALTPPPEAPSLRGTLTARVALSGPVRRPEEWRIDGDFDPSALAAAPSQAGTLDLARPFTWAGPLPDGRTREVVVGPHNPAFVPLGALPAHVVRAVLTSEDAGFYGHHGFDLGEIQDALAQSSKRRLRGASTITQQVAKNLFLSPERTYARKFREALATVALERSLGKRRLLEIYLNVAEWGPGVFGIGEAARHWFGKDARDLSPKEAAFLATVIPNPIRYEMYRRRGALTETWEGRVRDLLVKLRAADVISEEQLRSAWEAPLTFTGGA